MPTTTVKKIKPIVAKTPKTKTLKPVVGVIDIVAGGILTYDTLRAIVWNFADILRDKGQGTVEDYARVTVPTLAIKRILDLQEEAVIAAFKEKTVELDMQMVTVEDVLESANVGTYRFFDTSALKSNVAGSKISLLLLTWGHLMGFSDNPNGDPVSISLSHGKTYTTTAKTFVELMFEVIDALNPEMGHVFHEFDYRVLLTKKNIISYVDFYKVCHAHVVENGKKVAHGYSTYSLSNYKFDNAHVSSDIFGDVYMDLIGRFAQDAGKKGGEFFTPTPLVENGIRFLDLPTLVERIKNDASTVLRVGDPTCGSNTFPTGFHTEIKALSAKTGVAVSASNVEYFGQELKSFQASLGYMNMVFHGLGSQYNKGKSFGDMNQDIIAKYANGMGSLAGTFDVILANPPYGVKDYGIDYAQKTALTDKRWRFGVPSGQEGEFAFIMTALDLLNERGMSVLVLPLGTLFRDGGAPYRKGIVNEDHLEGLITLPANMFLTTSIPVVLWVFNKNKKAADKGKVFMVNAGHNFKKVGKFNEWHPKQALDAYHARTAIADYSGYVDLARLTQENFNLNVSRYFAHKADKIAIDIRQVERDILVAESDIFQLRTKMNGLLAQVEALNPGDVA